MIMLVHDFLFNDVFTLVSQIKRTRGNMFEWRCKATFTKATAKQVGPPQPTEEKVYEYDKNQQNN